jgi:acyl carrier protein
LGLDDNLLADGMIDSLGAVRLIAFIEERFGFQIPPKDLVIENFRTIHRLAAYLESRIDGSR